MIYPVYFLSETKTNEKKKMEMELKLKKNQSLWIIYRKQKNSSKPITENSNE